MNTQAVVVLAGMRCAVCGETIKRAERVIPTLEWDTRLGEVMAYRHASARGCDAARERSAAFWREAK